MVFRMCWHFDLHHDLLWTAWWGSLRGTTLTKWCQASSQNRTGELQVDRCRQSYDSHAHVYVIIWALAVSNHAVRKIITFYLSKAALLATLRFEAERAPPLYVQPDGYVTWRSSQRKLPWRILIGLYMSSRPWRNVCAHSQLVSAVVMRKCPHPRPNLLATCVL